MISNQFTSGLVLSILLPSIFAIISQSPLLEGLSQTDDRVVSIKQFHLLGSVWFCVRGHQIPTSLQLLLWSCVDDKPKRMVFPICGKSNPTECFWDGLIAGERNGGGGNQVEGQHGSTRFHPACAYCVAADVSIRNGMLINRSHYATHRPFSLEFGQLYDWRSLIITIPGTLV